MGAADLTEALAASGVRASFLDSAAQQALIEEIEAVGSGRVTLG